MTAEVQTLSVPPTGENCLTSLRFCLIMYEINQVIVPISHDCLENSMKQYFLKYLKKSHAFNTKSTMHFHWADHMLEDL